MPLNTLTRSEIIPEILESVKQTLGDKYQDDHVRRVTMVKDGGPPDDKIMVLTEYRTYILPYAARTKVEFKFNHLQIHTMNSEKPTSLRIDLAKEREKDKQISYNFELAAPSDTVKIMENILRSLQRTFPLTSIEQMIPKIEVAPQERESHLRAQLNRMSIVEQGPCGGFSQMYKFMCDYFDQPYLAEVAWDVDTIYLSQDNKELRINDFDDQEPRHMLPIIAVLSYNTWFTKLSVVNCKLTSDVLKEIPKVLQLSQTLESLTLEGVGLKADFVADLSAALLANSQTNLHTINLSNNPLHDQGIKHLCGPIAKMTHGLVELRLAKTGMTAEGASHLGRALADNNFITTTLQTLDLSGNAFKDAQHGNLYSFLCLPNNIVHLNLADSDCSLNNIFECLFRGCCLSLTTLNLSGAFVHSRLQSVAPRQVKNFFTSARSLKCINISRNKMPPAVVREILESIGFNKDLTEVEVDLSSNDLGSEGSNAISCCMAMLTNITTLNLQDNGFNIALVPLLAWISQNKSIQVLDLGQNMNGISKRMDREKIVFALEEMISTPDLPLHTISLANNKMRAETQQLINALGSNTTLLSVDLSGNAIGDIGARLLAKALQINSKLQVVKLDNNNISIQGFQDLANAMEKNFTLKKMPIPTTDMICAMQKHGEKTEAAIQQIQECLQRNHSPRKFSNKQAFLLQRGFLYTTAHQTVDKLVVHIDDMVHELTKKSDEELQDKISRARNLMDDANNSKTIFDVLQNVVGNSDDQDLAEKLKEIAGRIEEEMEARLERNANGMVDGTSQLCTYVMQDRTLYDRIEETCQLHYKLPPRFVEDLVEQISAETSNQCSEANLAMASFISDSILDEIIEQLSSVESELADELKKFQEDVASGVATRQVDSALFEDSDKQSTKSSSSAGSEETKKEKYKRKESDRDETLLVNGSSEGSPKLSETSDSSKVTTPPVMSKKQVARIDRARSMKRPVSHIPGIVDISVDDVDSGNTPGKNNITSPKEKAIPTVKVPAATEVDAKRQPSLPSLSSSSVSSSPHAGAKAKPKPTLSPITATPGEASVSIDKDSFNFVSNRASEVAQDPRKGRPKANRTSRVPPRSRQPARPGASVPPNAVLVEEEEDFVGDVSAVFVSPVVEGFDVQAESPVSQSPASSTSGSQGNLHDPGSSGKQKKGFLSGLFHKKDKDKDSKKKEDKESKKKEEKPKKEKGDKKKEKDKKKDKPGPASSSSYKSGPVFEDLDRSSKFGKQSSDKKPLQTEEAKATSDGTDGDVDRTDGTSSPLVTVAEHKTEDANVEDKGKGEEEDNKEEEERLKELQPAKPAPKTALRPMTGVSLFGSDLMAQLQEKNKKKHALQESKDSIASPPSPTPAVRKSKMPAVPAATPSPTEKSPSDKANEEAAGLLTSSSSKTPTKDLHAASPSVITEKSTPVLVPTQKTPTAAPRPTPVTRPVPSPRRSRNSVNVDQEESSGKVSEEAKEGQTEQKEPASASKEQSLKKQSSKESKSASAPEKALPGETAPEEPAPVVTETEKDRSRASSQSEVDANSNQVGEEKEMQKQDNEEEVKEQEENSNKVEEEAQSSETKDSGEPILNDTPTSPEVDSCAKQDTRKAEEEKLSDAKSQEADSAVVEPQPAKRMGSVSEKVPSAATNDVTDAKKEQADEIQKKDSVRSATSNKVTEESEKTAISDNLPQNDSEKAAPFDEASKLKLSTKSKSPPIAPKSKPASPPTTPKTSTPADPKISPTKPKPKVNPRPSVLKKTVIPKPELDGANFRASLKPVTSRKPDLKEKPKNDALRDGVTRDHEPKPRKPSDYKKVNGEPPSAADDDVYV